MCPFAARQVLHTFAQKRPARPSARGLPAVCATRAQSTCRAGAGRQRGDWAARLRYRARCQHAGHPEPAPEQSLPLAWPAMSVQLQPALPRRGPNTALPTGAFPAEQASRRRQRGRRVPASLCGAQKPMSRQHTPAHAIRSRRCSAAGAASAPAPGSPPPLRCTEWPAPAAAGGFSELHKMVGSYSTGCAHFLRVALCQLSLCSREGLAHG